MMNPNTPDSIALLRVHFYQELRKRYSRHRALQAELTAKVGA